MSVHNFDKSLRRESVVAKKADTFYERKPFAVQAIKRYNTGSEYDMKFQRQDIDLNLSMSDGRTLTVSEKFRDNDYDDLLLEIYSKYPSTKGWMHKSEAERLAYFFPKRMFWIEKKELRRFCLNKLFPLVEQEAIQRLLSQEVNSLKVGLRINDKRYLCVLTQAANNTDGHRWNTISISVPFEMLQDFSIRYSEYRL